MIVKNLERIQRIVVQLEAAVDTDRLDRYDRQYILQAIASLSEVCGRHGIAVYEKEFDDLRVGDI